MFLALQLDAVHTAWSSSDVTLDPSALLGIPIALIGAAFLSFGAQYQSRGLHKVERITGTRASTGLSFSQTKKLFARPSWMVGTLMLGLATLFQIGSLSLSPIMLVQPIGVVALLITAFLNMHYTKVKLGHKAHLAIWMSVIGVTVFVTVAAFTAIDVTVTDEKLRTVLIIFGAVFVTALMLFVALRHRAIALMYIIGTGVLYGFVATLAKTVISRVQQGDIDLLFWLSVGSLIAGAVLGMFFVQNAYSSGPPDLVIAGLTVIDPLIAVLIGVTVLGEAANASPFAMLAFVGAGVVAILGVFGLAKYHPQTGMNALMQVKTGTITLPDSSAGR